MQSEFQSYIMDRVSSMTTDGCWLWRLTKDKDGYGEGCFQKRKRRAHRLSYEAFVGPIPAGMHIDHLCRVRDCVNPEHLEPVTPGVNIRRGRTGYTKRTHCKRGHAFSEHGRTDTTGRSQCRICDRMRSARDYEKNREVRKAKARDRHRMKTIDESKVAV